MSNLRAKNQMQVKVGVLQEGWEYFDSRLWRQLKEMVLPWLCGSCMLWAVLVRSESYSRQTVRLWGQCKREKRRGGEAKEKMRSSVN